MKRAYRVEMHFNNPSHASESATFTDEYSARKTFALWVSNRKNHLDFQATILYGPEGELLGRVGQS